jgi:acyl-CoA thioesterase
MTNDEIIKNIIEETKQDKGFISNNHFKLVKLEDNYCILEAEITETSLNPYLIAHGGFIFGLADTAAGLASKTNGKKAVTLTSNINYLYPAKNKKLIATATCLKKGKTISVYSVTITDEKNKTIAEATFDYYSLN